MFRIVLLVAAAATVGTAICTGPEMYRIPDGRDYRGNVNVTVSGIRCQAWTSNSPHSISVSVPDIYKGLGDHNYCRNPFGDAAPGCFTTEESVAYELCSVGPVCKDVIAPVPQSVSLNPPSGSVVVGSFIGLQCLPKPCDLYVAIGDNVPSTVATKGSIVVPDGKSLTVIATAVFPDGGWKSSRVVYTVTPAPQDVNIVLLPRGESVFTAPVLVELVGGDGLSKVVFFGDSTTAIPYKQPFWIYATTTITAVVGDTMVKQKYTIHTPIRLPGFYPTGGVFVGASSLTMVPSVAREVFYYALNGSNTWTPAPTSNNIAITTSGQTLVSIYSTSIDVGASEVVNVTLDIVPPTAPECFPPPGTHIGATNITCTVGGKVKVDRLCVRSGGKEACAYTAIYSLGLVGTSNVTVMAADGFGSQLVSSYLYTIVPTQLPSPTPTVCSGVFSGPLLFGVQVEGQQDVTPTLVGNKGRLEAAGPGWILYPTAASEANYTYTLVATPRTPLVAVPIIPVTCTVSLYPSTPGKWTPSLRTNVPINRSLIATLLSIGNTTGLQVIQLPVGGVLVRSWAHNSLVSIYMRRLWDVLVGLGNVGVRSEVGAIPSNPIIGQQLNRTTLLACAATCNGRFVSVPTCTCVDIGAISGAVFEAVPSFSATLAVLQGGTYLIGAHSEVILSSLGDVSARLELTVVDKRFSCKAVGSPLQLVSEDDYISTIIYTGDYKVCADDGSGIFEVPFATGAYLSVTNRRPEAATLSPCGGAAVGVQDVSIRGMDKDTVVSVNGREWAVLGGVVPINLNTEARQVVSVVSYGNVQGVRQVVGSQSCLFYRTPVVVDMSKAVYTVEDASLVDGLYAVKLRLSGLPTGAIDSLLRVWVSEGICNSTAIPATSSYAMSDVSLSNTNLAVSLDSPLYIPANSSNKWSVCLSVNGAASILPQELYLSALHIQAAYYTPKCNCTTGTYCTSLTAPITCLCVLDHSLVPCGTTPPSAESSAPNPLVSIGILAGIAAGIAAAVLIRRSMNAREPSV